MQLKGALPAFSGLFPEVLGTRVLKASTLKSKPSSSLLHVSVEKECTKCIHPCTCCLITGCFIKFIQVDRRVFLRIEVFYQRPIYWVLGLQPMALYWRCSTSLRKWNWAGGERQERCIWSNFLPVLPHIHHEMNMSFTASPQRQTETSDIVNSVNLFYF